MTNDQLGHEEVSAGAVFDAWALVTGLDQEPSHQPSLGPGVDVIEVCRALVMLSGTVAGLLLNLNDGIKNDPLSLLAPLLRKTITARADPEAIPLLAGLLTAGLLGHDVLTWSEERLRIITGKERMGLVTLVWCQRDLYDHFTEPGRLDELIAAMLTRDPDELTH